MSKKGMMWNGLGLDAAVSYFKRKYGYDPEWIDVNPVHVDELEAAAKKSGIHLAIIGDRYILKNCMWLGVES